MSRQLGLFPGQGSQIVGMGLPLYENYELAKNYFNLADECLGFSLSEICFNGPIEKLTNTAIAQPAILLVSQITYELVRPRINLCAAVGHSLGEYSSLVAAKSLDLQDALLLVHRRGTYMQEAVPVGEGKMMAVLGKTVEEIEQIVSGVKLISPDLIAEIANINAPGQIVVSGNTQGILKLKELMSGSKLIDLPVSAPFHSSLMQPAADKLKRDLLTTKIKSPIFPVYSNCFAKAFSDPEEIREALYHQVSQRVKFTDCVENAINEYKLDESIEIGAGKVLSGLLKRIKPGFPSQQTDSLTSPLFLAS